MKNATYTIRGTLEILDRLDTSRMGNPKYLLRIGEVVCRTQTNSMQAYGVTNYRGKTVNAVIKDGKNGPELVYIK